MFWTLVFYEFSKQNKPWKRERERENKFESIEQQTGENQLTYENIAQIIPQTSRTNHLLLPQQLLDDSFISRDKSSVTLTVTIRNRTTISTVIDNKIITMEIVMYRKLY